mmetsp:Transcript_88838/g.256200  ORF Transcript_88838/g.256200 Transcript_88838/m.256200 type:complete len:131 (-) Transcript_88838:72-464(-)
MTSVPGRRWSKWVESLRLDERVEFGEGDMGLTGGIQVLEPSGANITIVDQIRRFGGSTSPAAQWPEHDLKANDDEDRFERLEKLIGKAMKKATSKRQGGGGGSSSIGGGGSASNLGSAHDSSGQSESGGG